MSYTLSASEAREHLVAALTSRAERIARAASLWHGFEGWLKIELADSFMTTRGLSPWLRNANNEWGIGHIGVEARSPLLGGSERTRGFDEKLVDLWISAAPEGDEAHYFELKVVFNNANKDKMAASWVEDMRLLSRLANKPASIGSIALAVGFESLAHWRALADQHTTELGQLGQREPFVLVPRSASADLIIVDMLFAAQSID